jgi:hypothetical protein
MPDFHMLAVGQPYLPDGQKMPEGIQYNYRGGGHELLMVLKQPSNREIAAIEKGSAEFALYADAMQIIFFYRFGEALPWSDAPFTIHRVPEEERIIPARIDGPEPHALLTVILVQQETGTVLALRATTFSPAFTVVLHTAIRTQAETPYDAATYNRQSTLYQRYSTTNALLRLATSRTTGGR